MDSNLVSLWKVVDTIWVQEPFHEEQSQQLRDAFQVLADYYEELDQPQAAELVRRPLLRNMPAEDVTFSQILELVNALPERECRLFACACAEISVTSNEADSILRVVRAAAFGKATNEELREAQREATAYRRKERSFTDRSWWPIIRASGCLAEGDQAAQTDARLIASATREHVNFVTKLQWLNEYRFLSRRIFEHAEVIEHWFASTPLAATVQITEGQTNPTASPTG